MDTLCNVQFFDAEQVHVAHRHGTCDSKSAGQVLPMWSCSLWVVSSTDCCTCMVLMVGMLAICSCDSFWWEGSR